MGRDRPVPDGQRRPAGSTAAGAPLAVRRDQRPDVRPAAPPADGPAGVWFLSLDAENPYVVAAGRAVFHVPYLRARIEVDERGDEVAYSSRRTHRGAVPARFLATYWPTGAASVAEPGSLADWLTARFAVYAADSRDRVVRGDIRHAPWRLAPAEWRLECETLSAALGLSLPDRPAIRHLADPVDVVAAWPTPLAREA